jgi:hypothetical protein
MSGKAGAEGEGGGGMLLTEEERKQLMATVEETAKTLNKLEVPSDKKAK